MSKSEKQKTHRMPQDGQTGVDVHSTTISAGQTCPVPELAALFTKMEAGTTPNWLDFMSAISAMVAFYTDCDSPSQCSLENNFCMSQK